MELEALRIVADWLECGTNGPGGVPGGAGSVNALLSAVPRDSADPQPPNVTVYDATRDGWVARLSRPAEGLGIGLPALAVYVPGDVVFDGEVGTVIRDGTIDIAVMVVDDASDTAPALAASFYLARAVMRSLKLLNDNANAAYRTRNAVALTLCASMKQVRGGVAGDGLSMSTGVLVSYHIRDLAP